MAYLFYSSEINQYLWVTDVVAILPSDVNSPRSITTTSFICMTIQAQSYTIAKAIIRDQNYIIRQLRYFDNNLSRTSKQAEIYFMNCILMK